MAFINPRIPGRPGDADTGYGGANLKRRPLLVLFYMDGCSHCIANKPMWDEMKRKYRHIPVEEIESANVPADEHISGFPTMKYKPARGRDRVISGQQASSAEIARKLGLVSRNTRRSSRRLSRHTRRRRSRH